MLAILPGYQKLDFQTASGDNIKGTNLYLSYSDDNENLVGETCGKFFVRPQVAIPENVKIGDSVNVTFNHKGKIESISKK